MRSNTSTTAIELAVLWSGLQPIASREALHTAPLLYDYARASGMDNAYWTSHHMLFANSRLYVQDLPTNKQCGATDLDPLADIDLGGRDDLLTARVERDIMELKEPSWAWSTTATPMSPTGSIRTTRPSSPRSRTRAERERGLSELLQERRLPPGQDHR